MRADRYLRFILTLIACELVWLGLKGGITPVVAQQQAPIPVIVTGFQIGSSVYSALPVAVVGHWPAVAGERFPQRFVREPVRVGVEGIVRVESPQPLSIRQPLIVQTGREPLVVETGQKPLAVESVQARGSQRPGLQ